MSHNPTGDIVWATFVGGATAAFLVTEISGYRGGRWGTLSAALRRWMGIDPSAKRKAVMRGVAAGGLIAFGIHILAD